MNIKFQMIFDAMAIVVALLLSFSISLNYWYLPQGEYILIIVISPILAISIFKILGLYRHFPEYSNYKVLLLIVKLVVVYLFIWHISIAMIAPLSSTEGFSILPRAILPINFILTVGLLSVTRIFQTILKGNKALSLFLSMFDSNNRKDDLRNAIIFGVGVDELQMLKAKKLNSEFNLVGFLSISEEYENMVISGLKVHSADGINLTIQENNIKVILVTKLEFTRNQSFFRKIETIDVQVEILSSNEEALRNSIRNSCNMMDELDSMRTTKKNHDIDISSYIDNKTILITGAGGTIGSELARQVLNFKAKLLILFDISESSLYQIHQELIEDPSKNIHNVKIIPLIGSVTNQRRLTFTLRTFKVDVLYHAAAYKHVPLVEHNILEGVSNNILGTSSCINAAVDSGVKEFILVSTDKAVRPTNVMGATKRASELIVQSFSNKKNSTKCSLVRFGNVFNSSGSVVPLFQRQINNGGPITITDRRVTRFFMSVKEAANLIIQAGILGKGGEVFILEMGDTVSIEELAKDMIELNGKTLKDSSNTAGDIEIKYIGLRPGEKLHEELTINGKLFETDNVNIKYCKEEGIDDDKLDEIITSLIHFEQKNDYIKLLELLTKLVSNYKPHHHVVDYHRS